MRLDQALVQRGLAESREKAQRYILAGQVLVNGQKARKASDTVKEPDNLEILQGEKFVSRGGHKLEHALQTFGVNPTGLTALDLGASTGGFTDCLLQHGAVKVYAVDVGHGQLAWKLRHDPRVVVMERTNARDLSRHSFAQEFSGAEIIVIDCSFISLRHILPPTMDLLNPGGKVIALIKPQFEAGKLEVDKGAGVIRDSAIHARVISELRAFVAEETNYNWSRQTESPLLGPAGNKEFLVLLERQN